MRFLDSLFYTLLCNTQWVNMIKDHPLFSFLFFSFIRYDVPHRFPKRHCSQRKARQDYEMKRTFQNVSSISLPPLHTMINGRRTKRFDEQILFFIDVRYLRKYFSYICISVYLCGIDNR